MSKERYNAIWPDKLSQIGIEMACIRNGGRWESKRGTCGMGLFHHYKEYQKLLWPNKSWHKWNDLFLQEILNNKVTGVLGPASSAKTRESCDFVLSDYWIFPKNTSALVCSTTLPMLDIRIWGEIKKQFLIGKENHDWLPGHLMESKHRIVTDSKFDGGRDFRNGIQGVACKQGGTYVGLGNFIGVKNERFRIVADELQLLPKAFIDAIQNLDKTPKDFKAIGIGNPKEYDDALGTLCEPVGGWDTLDRTEITKTWDGKFPGCRVVNLVGTDSPNKGFPKGKEPFPFLIKDWQIENDRQYYRENSIQFAMMDLGMMPASGCSNRVITRAMCEEHHAYDAPVFKGPVTKVFGLDAAYGSIGGDRCVGGEFWFGTTVDEVDTFALMGNPVIIPVNFRKKDSPENQIAIYVKNYCDGRSIPPKHVFYDSTGRGSLGTAFGRHWSTEVNPVEFGGKASKRPVSNVDTRPCHEVYGKFVTELWYSSRLVIESNQMRGLTPEVVDEGQMREYTVIDGKKLDVEPKDKTKERMKCSPDLFDMLVVALEGARRLGFQIAKSSVVAQRGPTVWSNEYQKWRRVRREQELDYAA